MIEGKTDLTSGGGNSVYLANNPSILAEALKNDDDDWKYAAGYIFRRYLGKKASDSYDSLER